MPPREVPATQNTSLHLRVAFQPVSWNLSGQAVELHSRKNDLFVIRADVFRVFLRAQGTIFLLYRARFCLF